MRLLRRLRLGYGSKADSYPHEKPHSAGIEFYGPNGEVGYWHFDGTEWVVVVNGVQTGTIPGTGGGGAGGIRVGQGSPEGPILPTNTPEEFNLPKGAVFATKWQLRCKPAGSITVDLRYSTTESAIPTGADSITGSNQPVTSSSVFASGNLSTWTTTTLAAGAVLQVVVTANTGVRWFSLTVY